MIIHPIPTVNATDFTQDSGVLVGTGSGTFQEETGATLRTSLGLGTGDSPQFTAVGIGTAPSFPLHILQPADGQGIRVYGFDDRSTTYFDLSVSSAGTGTFVGNNHVMLQSAAANAYLAAAQDIYAILGDAGGTRKLYIQTNVQDTVASIDSYGKGIFTDLDVDTLNFNGNAITDSTGEISLDDENLTTTGSGTFGTDFRVVGADIITNGDMSSATGWTLEGEWVISGGVATWTANNGNDDNLYQTGSILTAGKTYQASFDVSGFDMGESTAELLLYQSDGTVIRSIYSITGNGAVSTTFTIASSLEETIGFNGDNNGEPDTTDTFTIDNFVVKQIYLGVTSDAGVDIDTLNFFNNVISDSTGTISFDNDDLSSIGTITATAGVMNQTLNVGNTATQIGFVHLKGRTSGPATNKRGGHIVLYSDTTTVAGYLFANVNGLLVFDSSAQGSHTDTGVASLDLSTGNIATSGTLDVTGQSLFRDKVKFTQTDGNEYIDSLADGYLDYSVTTAHRFNMSTADTDVRLEFVGTTSSGLLEWMEDEDYFKFSDDMALANAEFVIFDKASGSGIKIDTATPTFGWADLQGNVTNSKGATKPTEATYRGGLTEFQFSAGDDAEIEYHIPHDYVLGTDIHLHIHWSHIGALVTGGTLTFTIESSYAKGHNQAAFSAPVTGTFNGTASTTQYQHIVSETQYSASTPSGLQIDTDDLEPDGVILMRFEMTTNNITVSGGAVPDPFIHHIDVHYQTTGLIGTKAKAPDFYA